MSVIYHDQLSGLNIPNNWVKNNKFNPCDVNEQNILWREGVDQGPRYRLISKYEEHYGIFARIVRVAFGVILSLIMISFAFESGRELVSNLLFNSVKNINILREIRDLSKIQNGAYAQLPESIPDEVKSPHEAPKKESLAIRLEEAKKIRCPIARETGIATVHGFYITPSAKRISLRSGAQLLEGSRSISNSLSKEPTQPKYKESKIVVIDRDCLEAAEEELRNGAQKVAVLMFASPLEPGGAMEEGNNGQEEDLCRRSNIFSFMWDQSHVMAEKILYSLVDLKEPHQKNPTFSSMTINRMIHVPQVTVFRSGRKNEYQMLEKPFEVGMLVSPALDRPTYEKVDGKARYKRTEDEEQLLKLIMTQLKVSYDENYDIVVLGAFGCGAFYNPPELIAKFYKEVIDTYFKGAFKKIVFAILDDGVTSVHNPEGNLKPFQECFASNG